LKALACVTLYAMLSSVLHCERAIQVNIAIMTAHPSPSPTSPNGQTSKA